jgi:hypothetical protein
MLRNASRQSIMDPVEARSESWKWRHPNFVDEVEYDL